MEIICGNCNQPFQGKVNRETCSVKCRREVEYKRRRWDRLEEKATNLELNALPLEPLVPLTEKQAEEWREAARTLRGYMGPRP